MPRPLPVPPSAVEMLQGRLFFSLSVTHMMTAKVHCFILAVHLIREALAFALAKAGRSNPARMAMIAMTTSSSISVKPKPRFRQRLFIIFSIGSDTVPSVSTLSTAIFAGAMLV